jgi:hypothetical protein
MSSCKATEASLLKKFHQPLSMFVIKTKVHLCFGKLQRGYKQMHSGGKRTASSL